MPETIDFTKIRGDIVEGQRSVFEQLICHLAQLDGRGGEFRRIEGAGGDGGVEALRILPLGRKVGYQAKFYTYRNQIGWNTLDDSVKTALTQHPELKCYVIAIPCDFTGKRAVRGGSTEGVWGEWDKHVKKWRLWAVEKGLTVEFELWTAFEIEAALLKPNTQHLIRFFFDRLVFTREWMQRHLDRTIHDLQARYSPDEHVDTDSLKPFDIIYRRDAVCRDLRPIFEVARNSNPRAAVALVENADIPEANIIAVENSIREFLDLEEAIAWNMAKSWPISHWLTSWYSMTRWLLDIDSAIQDKIRVERADGDDLKRQVANITKAYELTSPQVFGGHWSHLLTIDGSRAVLFVGRAGAGKSHVLARGTEMAWNAGAPVIHILGQHILDDDPRVSILKRLELIDWSFHEMLTALNLVAEAADTRAMLVIDALNEGRGTDVWRNHLSSFICEINQHDRIVLVVSCREEYLEYVVPSAMIAAPNPYPRDGQSPKDCSPLGKFVLVSVDGFRTIEERENALQMFMDNKGIARPTAPVLDNEFFNPLFMSSVCRSMAIAGIKVFPRGLRGTRDIFKFVLETKAKSLGTRHPSERIYPLLRATLSDLVGIMVKQRNDYVPLSEAMDVIESGFHTLPINPQTWLDVLEGADILRRDVERPWKQADDWSRPNEVIRFSFQRLQDNLIADRLISDCTNIDQAFDEDAPFVFLIKRSIQTDGTHLLKFSPQWVGVLGALWSAVAEQHKRELWDIKSFFGNPEARHMLHEFQTVFHSSIRERSVTAFTQRTKDIFDWLWKDKPKVRLAIILSFACVPGHPWNADFLTNRLFKRILADRDSKWSYSFISDQSEIVDRVTEIIDWSLSIDANSADAEVVRLAGITLTWLFTVTNRTIRDRATKALVNLLVGSPGTFPYLIDLFHSVDDPYVLDRLLAAGYGAICLDPTDERIASSAQIVADTIFGETEPPVHLSIRDWARSILRLAAERKLNPVKFDIERIRSSFGSAQPIFDINKEELAEIARTAGGDEIAQSCQWGHDFFSYVISSEIRDFSETPLTEPPPLTQDERADRFETVVREVGGDLVNRLVDLLAAVDSARTEELSLISMSKVPFTISMKTKKLKTTTEGTIQIAEEAFLNALPETMRTTYSTELAPKIHRKFDPPTSRNPEPLGLWIARRAYELGWSKIRFPDEPYSGDRSRPVSERIGKKYQWIALEELKARLADNFWIKADYGKPTRTYKCKQDIWNHSCIDPTILPPRKQLLSPQETFVGPPPLTMEDVENKELLNWPFRADHFENPESWLIGLLDGCQWLIIDWSESVNEKQSVSHPMDPFRRQIQAFVSLVAHRASHREQVVDCFLKDRGQEIDLWSLETQPEGYLAHEFGLLSQDVIPFWKSGGCDSVDIATPIITGHIEDDVDRSIEGNIQYIVPHPRIRHSLKINISDPRDTGLWRLPDGQVFLRKLKDRGTPMILNKELFDSWCRSEGLDYTWVYIGERTSWVGQHHAKWRRTLGAAWFEDGNLHFRYDRRDG